MKIKRSEIESEEQFNPEAYGGEGIFINTFQGYEGLFIVSKRATSVHFVGTYKDYAHLFPEAIEEPKEGTQEAQDQPKLITEEFALQILETGIKAAK